MRAWGGAWDTPAGPGATVFRVLGAVDARVGERRVDLGAPRQRCLLALLLIEVNQPVHVERLIDLMWGAHPHSGARNTIQVYVSRLRQALADHPDVRLITNGPCYQAQVDPTRIDLHVFRGLVTDAHASADDERAAAVLRQALVLWRGRPLDDVAPDHLRTTLCARLDEERVNGWEELIDVELRLGRHTQIASEVGDLAEHHPFRERIAAQYMTALYRAGRRADALVHYRDLRTRLANDLGIDPSPALDQLHQRILRDDPGLIGTPTPPASRRTPTPRQLPADATHFTGRDTELDHLLSHHADHHGPPGAVIVSAIDGMAGIGKTALAVHTAHQLAEHYPDGQMFIDLHGYTEGVAPTDPKTALDALLRSLGVDGRQIPVSLDERAALWRTLLADKRALILLDNASDEAQVTPLLPGVAGCLVLVTSRRRLSGLDNAEPVSLDVLPPPEAVALFTATAGPGRVAGTDQHIVESIVELCGRLPLAIRIAAARLRHHPTWTPTHLATLLHGRHGPLPALETGQRSITAALDLSYHHLIPAQQRLFHLLGLHPGPDIEPHAAAALLDSTPQEATRLLNDLHDANLLTEPTPGRYTPHDLIRHHATATARTTPTVDQHAALTRLLDYYTNATTTAMAAAYPYVVHPHPHPSRLDAPGSAPHGRVEGTSWLDNELPNLLAVALHAADHGRSDYTIALSTTLHHHLRTRAQHTSAEILHRRALTAARATGDHTGEVNALTWLGQDRYRAGRYDTAIEYLTAALDLARATGNRTAEVSALTWLGRAHVNRSVYDLSNEYLNAALDLARATGHRTGELEALDGLGRTHVIVGRYDLASDSFGKLLALARDTGDRTSELHALTGLGWTHYVLGRHGLASDSFGRLLALARDTGDRTSESNALTGLGRVHYGQGRYRQAEEYLDAGLGLARTTGNRASEFLARISIGHLHIEQGRYGLAAERFDEVLDASRATSDRNYLFEALYGLGRTHRAAGRPDQALDCYRRALDNARSLAHLSDQIRAHDGLASTRQALGDRDRARHHWRQTLDLLGRINLDRVYDVSARDIRSRLAELDREPGEASHGSSLEPGHR